MSNYQVCLKCRKLIYQCFSANETSSAKLKRGAGSFNEGLHMFAKDEKGYPFSTLLLWREDKKWYSSLSI